MRRITEDYVTFETAKLLKENGFNVMCDSMYIPDIRHNGKSISFDEELDLKKENTYKSYSEAVEAAIKWYNEKKIKI